MIIIGCDFHTRYQEIAWLETETGEMQERRLEHAGDEVRKFYSAWAGSVRVGIEATGYSQWFERMLQEMGHEFWIGDAAAIRASVVRKQKTDRRDAAHVLDLLITNRFPRIWVPTPAERDLRQLVLHRVKLVQMRTKVQNQLQAMAMGQGVCRKKKLWSVRGRAELESLPLDRWAQRRRQELLQLLDQLDGSIRELQAEVEQQARQHPGAALLMTHPGVGPVTSLAYVLTIGPASRFARGKKVASYLGLNPSEHSSGGHQQMGRISKQGNSTMRWLLVEAGQVAARHDPELRRMYQRLKFRKGSAIAKVAIARKLAVRLYWMLRSQSDYAHLVRMPGSSGSAVVPEV
jgi:transposase